MVINRADLFFAVLTGSQLVLSHETFAEFSWKRDSLCTSLFHTPVGFSVHAHLLGSDFHAIAALMNAFQTIQDHFEIDLGDTISIMHLDSHQASIESRLYNLGSGSTRFVNPILYCCLLASYLCTYMLFTEGLEGQCDSTVLERSTTGGDPIA